VTIFTYQDKKHLNGEGNSIDGIVYKLFKVSELYTSLTEMVTYKIIQSKIFNT